MLTEVRSVGLYIKHQIPEIGDVLDTVITFCQQRGLEVCLEAQAGHLTQLSVEIADPQSVAYKTDLIIVIGGDGSLLKAARHASEANTPIVGINRGHLGFLTDIHPDHITEQLSALLAGEYEEEQRFLLHSQIESTSDHPVIGDALNDVVLFAGQSARMIEFDILINNENMCHYRADGVIVASPTGSTAYALSAGGPILHPKLDAMVLVPMFAHTFSARPIVIPGDSIIEIKISHNNDSSPIVGCDGQTRTPIAPGHSLTIRKKKELLRLLHPRSYCYFSALRDKLGWG